MFSVGPYQFTEHTVLAPMAGVTDQPFRKLCRRLGAAFVVSEMVTSNTRLWHTNKSRRRLDHQGEAEPISVQIAGSEPVQLAEAAKANVQIGAQIIDINMGCPAKKVCNKAAGSALMKDEKLVSEILRAVRQAVHVPVSLKIRTGWDKNSKNAVAIAKMAEDIGLDLVSVHGRTRADKFLGEAEYATIADVKRAVNLPVLANGDIDSPQKAKAVLDATGADGLMIGRAAQGNPWIFRAINHYLSTGKTLAPPTTEEVLKTMLEHLKAVHAFYGEYMGVRIARKHLGWYLNAQGADKKAYRHIYSVENCAEQLSAVSTLFEKLDRLKETAA